MSQYLVRPEAVDHRSATATLSGEEAHHLIRVARVRAGEKVRLFDGRGNIWTGVVTEIDPGSPLITRLVALPPNEPDHPVHLLAGLIKGDRWEWLLEKAVELGATRITPLLTSRTVAKPPEGASRLARWEKIITAASKQCERGVIPTLDTPETLTAMLKKLDRPAPLETRLLFVERTSAAEAPRIEGEVRLAIGPEGGFTEEEAELFRRAGFQKASLGARILRAETAALAALSRVTCL